MLRFRIFAAALAALLFAACAADEARRGPEGVSASFPLFSTNEISVLECDPQKPELKIRIGLAYVRDDENPEAARRINDEILRAALPVRDGGKKYDAADGFGAGVERYVADEVASYQATWTEIFGDWGHSAGSENAISVEGAPRRVEGDLLVYEIRIEQDLGGAHPTHATKTLNFDLKTGRRLALKDVFRPGFEPALETVLARKAAAKGSVPAHGFPKPAPHENFALDADGVAFVFNPYEIAPYSSGEITLKALSSEIREWLLPPPTR
ncbi:MAG: RsiV family protein [Candidatus Spyradosoma sp.]